MQLNPMIHFLLFSSTSFSSTLLFSLSLHRKRQKKKMMHVNNVEENRQENDEWFDEFLIN